MATPAAKSPLLTITIDTTPPAVTSFGLAGGSGVTTQATVTLTGKTAPGTQVTLPATGKIVTAAANGSFSFTNVPVNYGTNVVTIDVADSLGNTATDQTTIERSPPSSTPPEVAAGVQSDTGLSDSDGVTSDSALFVAVQDKATVTDLYVAVDGHAAIDVPVPASINTSGFTISPSVLAQAFGSMQPNGQYAPLSDGSHTVSISAKDSYTNTSAAVTVTMNLLTMAPSAPAAPQLTAASNTTNTFLAPAAVYSNLSSISVQVPAASDAAEIQFTLASSALSKSEVVDATPANGTATASFTGLQPGQYQVTAVAVDLAGNSSADSAPLNFIVSTTPPATPTTNVASSTPTSVSVAGTTGGNVEVQIVRTSMPGTPLAQVITLASGNFAFTVPLTPGVNNFTVTAIDVAGNTSSYSFSAVSSAPDTTPPAITMVLANGSATNVTNQATITGTVAAASAITAFEVSVNGSPFASAINSVSNGTFTLTPSVLDGILGMPIPDGAVKVQAIATNASGFTSLPVEFDFTLDTAQPPTPEQLQLPKGTAVRRPRRIRSSPMPAF